MKNGDKPAYPSDRTHNSYGGAYGNGLTKRELFAAMVMQGFIERRGSGSYATLAHQATLAADALLKELEQTEKQNS